MSTRICEAIKKRSLIRFCYDEEIRIVEPYVHGMSKQNNEVLRGFQTKSTSKSEVGWKLFKISKISDLSIFSGQTFDQNRPNYNPDDEGMTTIHCHV